MPCLLLLLLLLLPLPLLASFGAVVLDLPCERGWRRPGREALAAEVERRYLEAGVAGANEKLVVCLPRELGWHRLAPTQRLRHALRLYDTLWEIMCAKGKEELEVVVLGATGRAPRLRGMPIKEALEGSTTLAVHTPRPASWSITSLAKRLEDKLLGLSQPSVSSLGIDHETRAFLASVTFVDDAVTLHGATPILALGGTFDRLHSGHKRLLTTAAALATKEIHVGLADGGLLADKGVGSLIESYDTRRANLLEFLTLLRPRATIHEFRLEDAYGPTITSKAYASILVTSENLSMAAKINATRKLNGLRRLKVFCLTRNSGSSLSSTRLRALAPATPPAIPVMAQAPSLVVA